MAIRPSGRISILSNVTSFKIKLGCNLDYTKGDVSNYKVPVMLCFQRFNRTALSINKLPLLLTCIRIMVIFPNQPYQNQ